MGYLQLQRVVQIAGAGQHLRRSMRRQTKLVRDRRIRAYGELIEHRAVFQQIDVETATDFDSGATTLRMFGVTQVGGVVSGHVQY